MRKHPDNGRSLKINHQKIKNGRKFDFEKSIYSENSFPNDLSPLPSLPQWTEGLHAAGIKLVNRQLHIQRQRCLSLDGTDPLNAEQQTQTTTGSERRWLQKDAVTKCSGFGTGWRYKGGSHKDKNRP